MNPVSFDISKKPPMVAGAEKLSEPQRQKLWGASRELEALFNGYLLGDLGKKLPGTGESTSSSMYAGLFKDALAHQLADGQHNGIAHSLYIDLTRQATGVTAKSADKTK